MDYQSQVTLQVEKEDSLQCKTIRRTPLLQERIGSIKEKNKPNTILTSAEALHLQRQEDKLSFYAASISHAGPSLDEIVENEREKTITDYGPYFNSYNEKCHSPEIQVFPPIDQTEIREEHEVSPPVDDSTTQEHKQKYFNFPKISDNSDSESDAPSTTNVPAASKSAVGTGAEEKDDASIGGTGNQERKSPSPPPPPKLKPFLLKDLIIPKHQPRGKIADSPRNSSFLDIDFENNSIIVLSIFTLILIFALINRFLSYRNRIWRKERRMKKKMEMEMEMMRTV